MTIIDCCIVLKMIKKLLVVLGVVDMRQLLLIIDEMNFFVHDIFLNTVPFFCQLFTKYVAFF